MNFALIPFAFVIGLATIVYAVSGRKWFTGPVRNIDTVVVREEDGKVIQETRRVVLLNEDDVGEQHEFSSQDIWIDNNSEKPEEKH
jgi:hypothetical protein